MTMMRTMRTMMMMIFASDSISTKRSYDLDAEIVRPESAAVD